MPCGGIYPCKLNDNYPCWVCNEGGCDLFCDEWDTPLHSKCLKEFLKSDEGQCVLDHGHSVIAADGTVLHEERFS